MRFLILLFSAFAAFAQQNLSSPTTVLDPASGASKLVLGNQYVQANGINTAGGMLDFRAITYSPSPGSTCYDEYGNLVSQPTVDIPPPAWVSTVTYASGATATLGTTIYKSVQAANLNHSPDTSPTWWRATGPATVFLAPNYNAGTTYAVNDQVNYGNTIYQSLQSANAGNTPSSSPTWWQPLGTAAADVLMWNSTSPLQGYAAPFTMVGGQPAFLTGTPCAPPVPVITGLPYGINLNSYIFARGGFATDGPEFNMIQLFNGGAVAQSFTAAGLYPRGTATNCCGTLTALGTYLGGYIQIGHSNGSPSSGTIATVNNPLTIGDGNEQGTMYWEDTASGIPFGYVNVYDGLTYAGLPQNNKPVNVTGVVTSGGIGAGSPVPAWSNAAAYNPGDEVSELVLGTNQLYEALLAGTGHDPNTSPTFWALLGPAGGVNVLTQTAYNSIQTVGGMSAALGYTTGQALYPQGYSSSSSLNHPASGYGGFGYNSGSIYWYWNGTAWVSLDLSAIGGCGIANEVHYNNGSGSCTGSTNFQYDGTTENITVATTGAIAFQISEGAGFPVQMDGAGNISGFGVIASTGPSGGVNVTGDNAINSIQTVGGLNIGSAGSNNGQIQWNGTTFINPNAALLNTTFKNINNNFQVNGNGTVSIVDVFNSTGSSGGVNVSASTNSRSIQTGLGGMYAGLGYTSDQAFYPLGYAASTSLIYPASGYGGFGYKSGSIYWYWNGTAWVSLDLSAIGGCGIANEVHYNNGSGSCTGSTNFQYDGTTENITVATTGAIAFQISEGAGFPVQMDGAGNISGFGVIASTGPSGGVNVTGDNAIKSIQTVGGLNIGSAGSNNGQIQWNGTTFINPNAALLNTTFKNINNNFQVNGNGTVSIVDVFNSTGSSGGVNVSASTNSRSIQTGLGGMYAGLGYTSDQAFYPLGYAASTSLIYPASGYGGFGYKSGSIYWYWNGTAWASVDLSATSGYWLPDTGGGVGGIYFPNSVGIGTSTPTRNLNISMPATSMPSSFGVPPASWQASLFQFGDPILTATSGPGTTSSTTYSGPFSAIGLSSTLTIPTGTTGSSASGADALDGECRTLSNSLGCVGVNGYGFAASTTNGAGAWGANFAAVAEPGASNTIMFGLEINIDSFSVQGQAAGILLDGVSPTPYGPANAVWISALNVSTNPTGEWKQGLFADDGCCVANTLGIVGDYRVTNSRSQPLNFKNRVSSVDYYPFIDSGSQYQLHTNGSWLADLGYAVSVNSNTNYNSYIGTNTNSGSSAQSRIQLYNDLSGSGAAMFLTSSGWGSGYANSFGVWNYLNGAVLFATNGLERFRVASNGFVGVGTTSPAALFSVGSTNAVQIDGSGNVSASQAFYATGGAGSGFNVTANTAYNSIQTVGGVLASGVLATGLVGFPGSGSAPGVYLNSSSGTYNFVIGQGQAGLELAGQDSTGTIKSSLLLGSASIATGVAVLNSTNSFIISSPTTTLTSHLYPSNYSGSTSVSGGSSSLCSGANSDMSGCFIAIGPAVVTVTFGSAWGQAPHCVVSSSAGGSNTPYINGPPGTSSFGVGVVSLSSTYYWYHCM